MSFRFFILRRRYLALICAVLAAAAIFAAVQAPVAITASAAARQLPIYCVERDQKVCSISFDAAWGDGRMRLLCLCGFAKQGTASRAESKACLPEISHSNELTIKGGSRT